MRHTLIKFPTSRNSHIAEEVMLPFRGVVRGRVLCGGLRDKNTYERDIDKYLGELQMSRDGWFQPVLRRTEDVGCKKCNDRHHRFMDEYEAYRAEYAKPAEVILTSEAKFSVITVEASECALSKTGECIRTDEAHKEAKIENRRFRWWVCPSHDS